MTFAAFVELGVCFVVFFSNARFYGVIGSVFKVEETKELCYGWCGYLIIIVEIGLNAWSLNKTFNFF